MRIVPLALAACASLAAAETSLPSVISDHMLLQRATSAPLWGWDAPGTEVRISFRGTTVSAVAGKDGRFEAAIPTGDAGGPFILEIAGSTRLLIQDVLVGEVWIAGGQSNMWWQLRNCTGGAEAIAASDLPQLRWFDANTSPAEAGWEAETPQRTVTAHWVASHPAVADDFAGPAFFFARALHQELKIPVAIVNTAVPGTAIESWLRPAILRSQFPDILELHRLRQMTYPQRRQEWEAATRAWQAAAAAPGTPQPPKPEEPANPKNLPGGLWNGTVAPLAPFAARGFLWWQGESNAARAADYRIRFPALISDWRHQWRLDDAPWIFVELANFGTRSGAACEDAPWPALRDAQKAALALPNVHRVSAIDVLEQPVWNIHPPDKALIGHRLLLAALATAYGRSGIAWSGPDANGISFEGGACRIAMRQAQGLRPRGGGAVRGFVLAGPDRVWHAAEARIDGTSVIVSSSAVPAPLAVRYAWMNNPDANLENDAGLPAWPFRSDAWPLCHSE